MIWAALAGGLYLVCSVAALFHWRPSGWAILWVFALGPVIWLLLKAWGVKS